MKIPIDLGCVIEIKGKGKFQLLNFSGITIKAIDLNKQDAKGHHPIVELTFLDLVDFGKPVDDILVENARTLKGDNTQ